MRKTLFQYSLIAAAAFLVIFLFQKTNWLPSFKNIFASQPVVIEETPIIIKEINTLSQLITVTYTDEVVWTLPNPAKEFRQYYPLELA